jgi:signal transduction histidine kinase
MTVAIFTSIILFVMQWEKRKQGRVLYQNYEVKQAEFLKFLEEHEALTLLGRMVASLAHELKTPIATISNLVQVLPDRGGDEKFIDRFTTLAGEELSRIQQLINNLLAYGKDIAVKNEEWINLPIFLHEIASKNSLRLEVPPVAEIYGDKFLLNLLFNNLMRNSKKEHADTVHVKIRTGKSADLNAEILLEDNGNGFTAGIDLSTLLKPFVTCHSSGAGLGLYLAKQVVTAHDGNIYLYRIEHGAGVNVTLSQKRVKLHAQT